MPSGATVCQPKCHSGSVSVPIIHPYFQRVIMWMLKFASGWFQAYCARYQARTDFFFFPFYFLIFKIMELGHFNPHLQKRKGLVGAYTFPNDSNIKAAYCFRKLNAAYWLSECIRKTTIAAFKSNDFICLPYSTNHTIDKEPNFMIEDRESWPYGFIDQQTMYL